MRLPPCDPVTETCRLPIRSAVVARSELDTCFEWQCDTISAGALLGINSIPMESNGTDNHLTASRLIVCLRLVQNDSKFGVIFCMPAPANAAGVPVLTLSTASGCS